MELRWFEAFIAVAEELHFGRAASRLQMAKSPLSQKIRRLERHIGTPVFERSTRVVSLTGSGRALLPYAYRIVQTAKNGVDAAYNARGTAHGVLNVGFSGMHNHHTLPLLTRLLRRDFPGVELKLHGGVHTRDGIQKVRHGDLDVAFIGLGGEVEDPLRTREISRHRIGAIVAADHHLADRGSVRVAELRQEPFIMGPEDGSSSITMLARQICYASGFEPQVAQAVSDPFLVVSMVAAGVGVTLTSSDVFPVLPRSTVWLEIEDQPLLLRHGIVWSDENDTPTLRALLKVTDRAFPLLPSHAESA